MTTKAKKKKKPDVKKEKAPEPEQPAPPQAEPAAAPRDGKLKIVAVAVLAIVVIALIYLFFFMPSNRFVPGTKVDEVTFKDIFRNSENVYIFMDVRGASSPKVSQNIMQCGVDFAGSSGMGGKSVTPISIDLYGCITSEGEVSEEECFAQLENGLTIYITEDAQERSYLYSNGMVVGVSEEYAVGTCKISYS